MNQLTEALQVIVDAEAALRRLMEGALSEHRYRDVAEVARLTESIARIRSAAMGDAQSAPTPHHVDPVTDAGTDAALVTGCLANAESESTSETLSREVRAGTSREVYPRFEREADRLIKIGWSKKERRVYEHRAPRSVIDIVWKALSARRPGRVFTMDQFLPFKDDKGSEIPSYQAYLVLAWLRDVRIVLRRGKEGYVVKNGARDDAGLERLWESTPVRE